MPFVELVTRDQAFPEIPGRRYGRANERTVDQTTHKNTLWSNESRPDCPM